MEGQSSEKQTSGAHTPQPSSSREQEALYQGNRIVARVLEAEVDMEAKEVQIGKIYESDQLMIPEECEYQRYRLLIQRIAFASKDEKDGPHRGRILRGVIADIMGYREQ
jgi:hypothetical protein